MTRTRRLLLRISVALTLALGLILAWGWQPDRPLDTLTPRWAPPPSEFVPIHGMQVHLRDEGLREDPLPLILIHGTSASLHTWDGWTEALQDGERVIRMDLRGFGLTGPAADGDYRIERYVDDLLALMDQLGIERAVLAGNSLGGQIAWSTAVRAPDRVAALVLVDAAGYPFVPSSIPIGFQLARSEWTAPIVRHLLPRALVAASIRNTYGQPERVNDALIERYFELTLRAGNREALIQRFRQNVHGEGAERIASIRAPTLILWGGRDRLIPPDNATQFQRDIRGSTLVEFPELGHVPQEEDPAQTVKAVEAFLASRR